MYQQTTATKKIQQLNKRIKAIAGGTSASKTVSILLLLINYAQSTPGKIISVTSESYPHLKRGAMRDFLNIMEAHHYFKDNLWNKTDSFYTFETGSIIEFFGVESWEKVKGARRDVLFINEANHVSYNAFTQMEVRTKEDIYLDWNPEAEFWFYISVMNREDCDFITLTYLDNEALDESIVKAIEARRNDVQWFKVYGLGQLGEVEGRIYTGWEIIDSIPHEAKLVRYGLDFGYSVDQTAIVAEYEYNGGVIFDEILYSKGLSNREIAEIIKQQPKALIIADSAEPKSIAEIKDYIKSFGYNIIPTEKGKDSVLFGIQYLQDKKVSVTKQSINLIDEYRAYLWMKDKLTDEFIKEPSPIKNHLMDACRYSASSGQKLIEWKPQDPGGVKPYIENTLI
jgi:phage terminase large subunit